MNTHYYIEDPYAEALRKNAINLVSNGGLHSGSVEPVSPMNSVAGTEDQSDHSLPNNMLNTISSNALLTPVNSSANDSALLFGYASINGLATITGSGTLNHHHQIPPMPPLRSNMNDKLLNGYSVGYATLTAPGSRSLNNNLNNNNNLNMNNMNNGSQFPSTLPNASIGHLV